MRSTNSIVAHFSVLYVRFPRLLCRYPLKTAYTNKPVDFTTTTTTLQSTKIEDVITKAPCILHIESFDSVFCDPAQQHSSNPEDSQEETFLRALKAFTADLYNALEALPPHTVCAINQRSVVILVSTNMNSSIKSQLKSMFGAEVKLSPTIFSDTLFTELLAQNNVHTTNSADTSITPRHSTCNDTTTLMCINSDARKALYSHVSAHNMSCTIASLLVNEVKKRALSRVYGTVWLAVLGVDNKHMKHSSTNNSNTATNTTTDGNITITTADVRRATAEVPCLNAFDTTSGTNGKKGGSKQATIAPVHWADIGGLDR